MKLINYLENKVNNIYFEGGNAKFEIGNKIFAVSKLNLSESKITFTNFKNNFFKFLDKISKEFEKVTTKPLWLNNEKHFSGSSNIIFNQLEIYFGSKKNQKSFSLKYLNNQKFKDKFDFVISWMKKFKPEIGDIDIQVSNEPNKKNALIQVLKKLSLLEKVSNEEQLYEKLNKKCPKINDIALVHSKLAFTNDQVISICAIRKSLNEKNLSDFLFFQCDWEFVETNKKGIPTKFAKFSRSSSIEDLELGIKGREHKYLLRALANSIGAPVLEEIKVFNPETLRELKSESKNGLYSFSVIHGLRKKFWDPNDEKQLKEIFEFYKENAKKVKIETLEEFKKIYAKPNIRFRIPQEKRQYIKLLTRISKFFNINQTKMFSFISLVGQIKDLIKNNKIALNNIITNFENKLLENLTIAPHTITNASTLEEKLEKAFELDFNSKINAYSFLLKELTGKDDISEFKAKYNEWKERVKPRILARYINREEQNFSDNEDDDLIE